VFAAANPATEDVVSFGDEAVGAVGLEGEVWEGLWGGGLGRYWRGSKEWGRRGEGGEESLQEDKVVNSRL